VNKWFDKQKKENNKIFGKTVFQVVNDESCL